MRNFADTFERRKRSFISAFSICMNVPLTLLSHVGFIQDFILLIGYRNIPGSNLIGANKCKLESCFLNLSVKLD